MDIIHFFDDNWNSIEDKKKIELLQGVEHYFADIQNRKERVIKKTDIDYECAENAGAQYNFSDPDFLFIRNYANGMKSFMSIVHEGIHAMFDDALNGKISEIYMYDKVDTKRLMDERAKKDIIYNGFVNSNNLLLFNLCYIEEKIAHHETKYYILEEFLRCISKDKRKAGFGFYEKIFIEEINRINYLNTIEKKYKTNYEVEIKKINYDLFKDKLITNLSTPVIRRYKYASSIIGHFRSQLQIYKNIHNPKFIDKKIENINKFKKNMVDFKLQEKN